MEYYLMEYFFLKETYEKEMMTTEKAKELLKDFFEEEEIDEDTNGGDGPNHGHNQMQIV